MKETRDSTSFALDREKFHQEPPTETRAHGEFYERFREVALAAASSSSVSPLGCTDFTLAPVAFPTGASPSCWAGDVERSPAGMLTPLLRLQHLDSLLSALEGWHKYNPGLHK